MPAIAAVGAGERGPRAADGEADVVTAGIEWREVSDVVTAASVLLGGAGEGIGSNSWVVSGELTDTGMPLLSNDPHLGASLPSVWHQIQLRCATRSAECPFDVAGFGFSGRARRRSSATTTGSRGGSRTSRPMSPTSTSRRCRATSTGATARSCRSDIRTETIEVAGGDDVELEIRSTVHGPIVSGLTEGFTAIAGNPYLSGDGGAVAAADDALDGEYAVSLRWTALEPGTTAQAIFQLNLAQDFDDFRAAAQRFDVPAQNLIYADVDGNIGYQTPGKLPIRGAGDGWMPQPGWDSAYDWQGLHPVRRAADVVQPGLRATSSPRTTRSSTSAIRTSSRATGTTATAPPASSTCIERKVGGRRR